MRSSTRTCTTRLSPTRGRRTDIRPRRSPSEARRRLPTEAEWEAAAALDPATGTKRRFPWGDAPPTPERAQLDARVLGCADVAACPEGDAATGCRQMIGNVWEWTDTPFAPYPG